MTTWIDETGNKYGKMTVLEKGTKTSKSGSIYWICQCECGKIEEVNGNSLRRGEKKQCRRCATENSRKKIFEKTFIDITGQKFGKLTAIRYVGTDNGECAMWECQCDCGKIITARGSALRTGATQSCGCIRTEKLIKYNQENNFINITGWRFGHLVALEPIKRDTKKYYWKCQCDCGKIIEILGQNLRRGNSTSCGCNILSRGEEKIIDILKNNNIVFQTQKTFDNCRFLDTNMLARFDFYLQDYNILIEYDGRQHFLMGEGKFDNPEKFKKTQEHDIFKNQWAKNNNIPIIRIPYTHYDNLCLEDLLPETSQFLVK